ncbi:protein obstructor-E-like [Babylonia areolata]|uniref:protein obstructor-E-like n=1 Tax=Babylonia areolata TaxID=304850 RepID=UPI003FD54B80
MLKTIAAAAVLVVVVVVAEDYYYDPEFCGNIHPGLWRRDPQDCSVAHQCGFNGEVSQSVRCNASQVWSVLASACVWEWDPDRDDCNGSPQVPIPNDPRCVKKTGNNPDPDDCSRFVSCANGTMIAVQRCGDGTLYWPKNNTCEFAEAVVHECGSRKIPETIIIREEDPLCRDDGQAPDPQSCRHFILCQHGRRTQRIQCPHGTAFSTTSRKCEWHSEVNCNSRE